jgi:hypothetical protein
LKLDIGNAGGNMKLDIIGGNATGGNMKLDWFLNYNSNYLGYQLFDSLLW